MDTTMTSESQPSCEFNDDMLMSLSFSGPADVATINPVVAWAMDAVKNMGCAVGKEWEVEVALREAISNAMIHGSKGDPTKVVQVCMGLDKDNGLLIVVRDQGPGFDPTAVKDPLIGQNVYSDHGRGIYLINQLMDEVTFGRGGTEIRMRKRYPPNDSSS
jgi:serine/threonine-protein kinase RsbW